MGAHCNQTFWHCSQWYWCKETCSLYPGARCNRICCMWDPVYIIIIAALVYISSYMIFSNYVSRLIKTQSWVNKNIRSLQTAVVFVRTTKCNSICFYTILLSPINVIWYYQYSKIYSDYWLVLRIRTHILSLNRNRLRKTCGIIVFSETAGQQYIGFRFHRVKMHSTARFKRYSL